MTDPIGLRSKGDVRGFYGYLSINPDEGQWLSATWLGPQHFDLHGRDDRLQRVPQALYVREDPGHLTRTCRCASATKLLPDAGTSRRRGLGDENVSSHNYDESRAASSTTR